MVFFYLNVKCRKLSLIYIWTVYKEKNNFLYLFWLRVAICVCWPKWCPFLLRHKFSLTWEFHSLWWSLYVWFHFKKFKIADTHRFSEKVLSWMEINSPWECLSKIVTSKYCFGICITKIVQVPVNTRLSTCFSS